MRSSIPVGRSGSVAPRVAVFLPGLKCHPDTPPLLAAQPLCKASPDDCQRYDSGGALVDRLSYGDQTFPGTIRAQNISGQAPCIALGQNTIANWVLSAVGDAYGSVQSNPTPTNLRDIGSPGVFVAANCSSDPGLVFMDGFEVILR